MKLAAIVENTIVTVVEIQFNFGSFMYIFDLDSTTVVN